MAKIRGVVSMLACDIAKKIDPGFGLALQAQLLAGAPEQKLAANDWYDLPAQDKPMTALAYRLFPGDAHAIRRLGALLTKESTSAFHHFFMRVPNSKIVFLRAVKTWQTFYDTGEFDLEMVSPNTVMLHVRRFPDLTHCLKEIITGNLEGLGELMSRKVTVFMDDSNPNDVRWQAVWI